MNERRGPRPSGSEPSRPCSRSVESAADEIHKLELGYRAHAVSEAAEGCDLHGDSAIGMSMTRFGTEAVDEAVRDFESAAVVPMSSCRDRRRWVALHSSQMPWRWLRDMVSCGIGFLRFVIPSEGARLPSERAPQFQGPWVMPASARSLQFRTNRQQGLASAGSWLRSPQVFARRQFSAAFRD